MQDILLEPYGGQILGLAVGATTALTALMAAGALLAFALAARWLARRRSVPPGRLGVLSGIVGFAA
jgi:BCD family chlorophyll transporter-like MFS transporter